MEKESKKNLKWYDSANTITNTIIAVILIIIICSQSFAIIGDFSLTLLGSIINHNSIYLFILIYFILLKFSFGKKYFNYLNLFFIFLYFIVTITSLLTVIQVFSLNGMLDFTINFILLIYLSHTMFRDTRIWKEFKLYNSPFNELTNEWLYYCVVVVSLFLLAVNLIGAAYVRGMVISILDCLYYVLLGRYIYLYREYLDKKNIDTNNSGNFDGVRKTINDSVQDVLDKTDIDEKVIEVKDMIVDEVQEVLDKTDIDEKIVDTKNKVVEKVKDNIDKNNKDTEKISKTTKKTATKKTTKKKGDK